jgi:transposase-like protein
MTTIILACVANSFGAAIAVRHLAYPVCPSCSKRRLVLDTKPTPDGSCTFTEISHYRCPSCGTEWRRRGTGPLLTREAFEAGATEPPPTATARKRDDR